MAPDNLLELTADIVSAHVSNNDVASSDLPLFIRNVFEALARSAEPVLVVAARQTPAVPVRASIKPDHIVCLEDGAKLKMMKRYLRTNFNMSPDDYRAKWNLPSDYPMVAPAYAETRRSLALSFGLGKKPRTPDSAAAHEPSSAPDRLLAPDTAPVATPKIAGRAKLRIATPVSEARTGD